jgi:hypothetical protein
MGAASSTAQTRKKIRCKVGPVHNPTIFLTARTTTWDFHILFSPFVTHHGLARLDSRVQTCGTAPWDILSVPARSGPT